MSQEEVNNKAKQAVLKYNVNEAKAAAQQAIDEKLDLVQVIEKGFTAGIQEVGELFEQKKLFLPHIMAAANAMNAGVDMLTPEIEKAGSNVGEGLGKFVIATIEGDIHSIGKDIVAIMLKVAGFDVINMGRDVPCKDIVEACKKEKPVAVGSSALMTSTMVNQKHQPAVGRGDRSRRLLRERHGLRRQDEGRHRPVNTLHPNPLTPPTKHS